MSDSNFTEFDIQLPTKVENPHSLIPLINHNAIWYASRRHTHVWVPQKLELKDIKLATQIANCTYKIIHTEKKILKLFNNFIHIYFLTNIPF